MARNRNNEAVENEAVQDVTQEIEAVEADAVEADAVEADAVIEPGVVTVENAVSEEQMRERVARLAKGRKNYELCGVLKASPSTISSFIKGKAAPTKQMLAGLGVAEKVVYVVVDRAAFDRVTLDN